MIKYDKDQSRSLDIGELNAFFQDHLPTTVQSGVYLRVVDEVYPVEVCIYVYIDIDIYTSYMCTNIYIYTYIHTHTHTHTTPLLGTHVCMYCMYVCMCVCVCVCVCIYI
jgi:hypothetical protein